MKVPGFRPPTEGDFPDLDEQTIAAVKVVGDQVELVTQALQSNISPEDNGNSEVRVVALQHGVTTELEVRGIKGKPREVVVMDQERFDSVRLAWEVVDQEKIRVRVDWDSEDNQNEEFVSTTLLVRGS